MQAPKVLVWPPEALASAAMSASATAEGPKWTEKETVELIIWGDMEVQWQFCQARRTNAHTCSHGQAYTGVWPLAL